MVPANSAGLEVDPEDGDLTWYHLKRYQVHIQSTLIHLNRPGQIRGIKMTQSTLNSQTNQEKTKGTIHQQKVIMKTTLTRLSHNTITLR